MKLLTKNASHLRFWRRKRFWLIVTPFVVMLAAGAVVWCVSMQQTFAKASTEWRQRYQSITQNASATLHASQKDGPNLDKVLENLTSFEQQLTNWRPPVALHIFGIGLGDAKLAQKQRDATQQQTKVLAQLQKSKALLQYQPQVAPMLSALSGNSSKNLDELKALAADWQAKADLLAAITPPEDLKVAHQALAEQVGKGAEVMRAMILLYEKQDVAGFAVKQGELAVIIDALKAQSAEINTVFTAQDAALQAELHTLDHLVE